MRKSKGREIIDNLRKKGIVLDEESLDIVYRMIDEEYEEDIDTANSDIDEILTKIDPEELSFFLSRL